MKWPHLFMVALACSAVVPAPLAAEPSPKVEHVPDSILNNLVSLEMFAGTGKLGRLLGINVLSQQVGQLTSRS